MKKFTTKIQIRYDKLFAEARASRWMGFYQYAEKLLLRCYKYYKRTKQKKELSNILKELVDIYMESERFSQALVYVKELLELFEQFGTKINMVNTFNDLGRIYQSIGKTNLATEYFEQSLKISIEDNYKLGVSLALTNLAAQLRFEGKFENALNNLMKAEEICENEGYYENLVVILIGIGSIYSDMGMQEKTEEYLRKAEKSIGSIGNARLVASFYGELGTFYQWIGNLDKSVEFLNKSLQISRARKLKITTGQIFLNLGIVMSQKGEYDESYNYLIKALKLFKEIKNKILISRVLTSLGILFKNQKNYHKAIKFLEDSQNIAKNENDIMLKIRNYGLLGECYKETKKYYESYRNFTQCLFHYQQLLNNINTISLKESFKERFEDLNNVVHELNNLLESGKIDPEVSEIIKTKEITINTCKKSKEIYPNLPKEDLIKEIEKLLSITDDLKGVRLETDARKMLRKEKDYRIEDSGKNWLIKKDELKPLVEENCYQDYSNRSIEIDIYGDKKDTNRVIYVLGECKYRNKPMSNSDIKCFIIKSNIIAKNYITHVIQDFTDNYFFHLILISINGFYDKNQINNSLGDYWSLPKDKILNKKVELIDKELFIKLLKKNKIPSRTYEKF